MQTPDLTPGLSSTGTVKVIYENTAAAMGSGSLEVFATPAMVTLMENAAVKAVQPLLDAMSSTTVGTQMNVSHLKASKLGETITATAILTSVEGRKLTFKVEARDSKGVLIGEGAHDRFIIDPLKFLSKL